MTEARYRGQKVIAVAPDYADNVKFADEWLPAQPGTDGALAMAMGHVVLKEFFVDRQTPYFTDYVKTLHRPAVPGPPRASAADGDVHRRASSSPPPTSPGRRGRGERRVQDRAARRRHRRAGGAERLAGLPLRRGRRRAGGTSTSATSTRCCRCSTPATESVAGPDLPRFDTPDGAAADLRRGVPVRRVGGHLVTTVFDLLLAQYGVGRDRAARASGRPATTTPTRRTPRPGRRRSPASRPRPPPGSAASSPPNAEESQRPLDDRHGRRHQPLVPLRHDLPRVPHPDQPDRLPGRQRRRLGALRRPGEGPPDHRLHPDRQRAGLEPAAAQHDPDRVLVPAHRPVPLRPVRRRHARPPPPASGQLAGQDHRRRDRAVGADGLDAVVPDVRPQPARPQPTTRPPPASRSASTSSSSSRPGGCGFAGEDPDAPGELPPGAVDLAGQPARLLGQGQRVLPQAPARHRLLGARHRDARRASARATCAGATRRPRASSTCC